VQGGSIFVTSSESPFARIVRTPLQLFALTVDTRAFFCKIFVALTVQNLQVALSDNSVMAREQGLCQQCSRSDLCSADLQEVYFDTTTATRRIHAACRGRRFLVLLHIVEATWPSTAA
jgi:hypothetical protein